MESKQPHIIFIPVPLQGHINPMTKLARLLHSRGFYITFVHTEFNYARMADSLGSESPILRGTDNFCFETIPDGFLPENKRGVQDLPELSSKLLSGELNKSLNALLVRLLASPDVPPVTCILADAHMNFTCDIAKELSIRVVLLYTTSACGALGFFHFDDLVERGLFPLKDESSLTNGYLDTPVDWIPGLTEGAKMKHLPTFWRSTDPNDMFNHGVEILKKVVAAGSIILNTFDELEDEALEGIRTKIPGLCTIGPLPLLCQQAKGQPTESHMWKEDSDCLTWLDKQSPKSVIYVNYGSLAILTSQQMEEFSWGLANSRHPFLWIMRNDLIIGESEILTPEYMKDIEGRGFISSWCAQEKVLKHPSVAAFFTHCGWNSTLESICEGMPMICWPFFADQQMNCLYACSKWGIGLDLGEGDVQREKVERMVREIMEGEKGSKIRQKAKEWKKKAEVATQPGGSSYCNFYNLVSSLMGVEPCCHKKS